MAKHNIGKKNGMWKGGRSVASNGYVLIRVGMDHHLADVRGYAYEHRLVAEKKIGRKLKRGEQVHHINGDKTDNRPENLDVMRSAAHHGVAHRSGGKRLRMPGESNPVVGCKCGCGSLFRKYDESGRQRVYVPGHNRSPSPTQDKIKELLSGSGMYISDMEEHFSSKQALKVALSKMKRIGLVDNPAKGFWVTRSQDNGR